MPLWDSNNPRDGGWPIGAQGIVAFTYAGHAFPGGVATLLHPWFTAALDILCAQPGFLMHSGDGLGDGDWGFEVREVTAGGSLSFHSAGRALDINAPWNGYGAATPPDTVFRLPRNTTALLEPLGMIWGGSARWGTHRDWMHIQSCLTVDEAREHVPRGGPVVPLPNPPAPSGGRPFPLPAGSYYGPLAGPQESISGMGRHDGPYRPGLMAAQGRLGVTADGAYGPRTAAAARRYQQAHGLAADGLIGRRTWAKLFPA